MMLIEFPSGKTTITAHDADRISLADTDLLDIANEHPHLTPVLEELQRLRVFEQYAMEEGGHV